jgi:hypothetical protein
MSTNAFLTLRAIFIALMLTAATPVQAISVPCTGNALADGAELRTKIEGAVSSSTVSLGVCTYEVEAVSREGYNTGILIENKAGLTIVGAGQGQTIIKLQRPVYIGLEIRTGTNNLLISNLTIEGSITAPFCDVPALDNEFDRCRTAPEPMASHLAAVKPGFSTSKFKASRLIS